MEITKHCMKEAIRWKDSSDQMAQSQMWASRDWGTGIRHIVKALEIVRQQAT